MATETDWVRAVACDNFFDMDGRAFTTAKNKFLAWAKEQPRDTTLSLPDGWHTITPQIAEELLKRNTRNRPVDFHYVLAYGTQMINGRWKKTGEPVIINGNGDVDDAGHRLWACYLSGASFETYVVNVDYDPDLFAFIDNGRSRNGADTLFTAGLNGVSKLVSSMVKGIAFPFDEGVLRYNGRMRFSPCTNIDVLDYVRANPELVDAVKVVKDLYPAAMKRIGDPSVACFVGWKIQTIYGGTVLEDFMVNLTKADLPKDHPCAVLQKRLDDHEAAKIAPPRSIKTRLILTQVQILGLTIKAFNLSRASASVRRLDPRADDPFPHFDITTSARREAAE